MPSHYNSNNKLEKFYTPKPLIDELFILKDKCCDVEITEYLENSAGGGAICDRFDKPYIAFDIEPEPNRLDIKKCDYLREKIEYKQGRVCIMNPPFHKAKKFINKSLKECDWVFCIVSSMTLFNFDFKNVWAEEIQLWVDYKYPGLLKPKSLLLMALRPLRKEDKYELHI
jgi:predicted RNA methylase